MGNGIGVGAHRRLGLFGILALTAQLSACGVSSNLLPAENAVSTSFASYEAVEAAYDQVKLGETDTRGLAQLGFDMTKEPNVERLSYLSVINRFMPEGAVRFENLAPTIQNCINAQERCVVVIFRPARRHSQRTGSVVMDLTGFERASVDTGWSAEVIFLVQDGTVVYKVIQGNPSTKEVRDDVQPLGPLQNLGNTVVRIGSHMRY
jgi:hypothetical protein